VALKAALAFVEEKQFETTETSDIGVNYPVYNLPQTNRHGCDIYGNGTVFIRCKKKQTQYTLDIR
jgi:hypothetical protein